VPTGIDVQPDRNTQEVVGHVAKETVASVLLSESLVGATPTYEVLVIVGTDISDDDVEELRVAAKHIGKIIRL
jgi:hypothetical protein